MGRNQPPDFLPPAVRDHPEVIKTCQEWNLGRLFRIVQNLTEEPAKFTDSHLARRCGLTPSRVAAYMANQRHVTEIQVITRVADGLHIPGERFGLTARYWQEPDQEPPLHSEEDVKRRELLRGMVGVGLVPPTLTALDTTRRDVETALTASQTQPADIGYWEQAAERYGYGYHGQAPVVMLADLASDFHDMRPLLSRSQSMSSRYRACHVTARFSSMIGIVLHDLGKRRDAHAWFRTATLAAEETGDGPLQAWVLAREAMIPLNYGAPQAAAKLAARAQAVAGREPSPSAALAAAVASRANASLGNADEALAQLAYAEDIFERLDTSARADTWVGYPEQKHRLHASQTLTLLGSTRRAYASQQRALELTRTPVSMSAALLELDRAICLQHDDETTEACQLAYRTVDALPTEFRTDLVLSRARYLLGVLPTNRANLADARALAELIRASSLTA